MPDALAAIRLTAAGQFDYASGCLMIAKEHTDDVHGKDWPVSVLWEKEPAIGTCPSLTLSVVSYNTIFEQVTTKAS